MYVYLIVMSKTGAKITENFKVNNLSSPDAVT